MPFELTLFICVDTLLMVTFTLLIFSMGPFGYEEINDRDGTFLNFLLHQMDLNKKQSGLSKVYKQGQK